MWTPHDHWTGYYCVVCGDPIDMGDNETDEKDVCSDCIDDFREEDYE